MLLTLQGCGVRFLACDMPGANDLTVGIMALVAQQERETISRHTGEALQAARARDVKLGNPNGSAARKRAGRAGEPLRKAVKVGSDQFARTLAPVLECIMADGHDTLRAIACEIKGCPLSRAEAAPLGESGGAVLLEAGSGGEAALVVEKWL